MSAEETLVVDLLRLTREQRGETVEQAHQQTGITKKVIYGLEGGDAEVVEPVYMRLAALTYARHLDLDVDWVAELYDAQSGHRRPQPLSAPVQAPFTESPTARDAFPKPSASRADLLTRLKTVPPAQIAVLAAVVVVIALIFYWLSDSSPEGTVPSSTTPPAPAATRQGAAGQVETEELDANPALASVVLEPPETVSPAADGQAAAPADAVAAGEGSPPPAIQPPPGTETLPQRGGSAAEEGDPGRPSHQSAAASPQQDEAGERATADGQQAQPLPGATGDPPAAATPAADAGRVGEGALPVSNQTELPPLVLQAHAVDSTWVRIRWDETGSATETIPPGGDRSWEARDFFLVRAGRAHGVRFTFQGDLLGDGRLGEATEVLVFRASREGVVLLRPDEAPVFSNRDSTATTGAQR